MRKVTLLCVDAGYGHACGLSLGLENHCDLTTVWVRENLHGLDYLTPKAKYGLANIPPKGDEIIIMACCTHDYLRKKKWLSVLDGYDKVKIIVTDGGLARYPESYNYAFRDYEVFCTICKMHFRGDLPTGEYYQPFDFTGVDTTKNKELTISHSPFGPRKRKEKGSDIIEDEVSKHGVNYDLITQVKWPEVIRRKAMSHIFVDQIDHYAMSIFKFSDPNYEWPALGKSGIEGMHLGCLTITRGEEHEWTKIPYPPVAWCLKDNFGEVLSYYINNQQARDELIQKQQAWAMRYATHDAQAKNVLGYEI